MINLGNLTMGVELIGATAAMRDIDRMGAGMQNLGRLATAAVSVPLLGAAAASLKLAASFEQTQVAFTSMLKDGNKATRMLSDLQAMARKTPFQFTDLTQITRQLLAYGTQAKDVLGTLTDIGDATAAMGGGSEMMERVSRAIGQIQSKGALAAEEMRQLAEAGIPAWQMLAKYLNTDVGTAMKMVENRAVSASTAITAIRGGIHERFGGMMAEQSKTAAGQFSNLVDKIKEVGISIGNDLMPSALKALDVISRLADSVKGMSGGTLIGLGAGAVAAGPAAMFGGEYILHQQMMGQFSANAAGAAAGNMFRGARGPQRWAVDAYNLLTTPALREGYEKVMPGFPDHVQSEYNRISAMGKDPRTSLQFRPAPGTLQDVARNTDWTKLSLEQQATFRAALIRTEREAALLNGRFGNLYRSSELLRSGTLKLQDAFVGLTTTLGGALIIGGLIVGAMLLINSRSEAATKAALAEAEAVEKKTKAYGEHLEQIRGVVEEYDRLQKKQNKTEVDLAKMKSLEAQNAALQTALPRKYGGRMPTMGEQSEAEARQNTEHWAKVQMEAQARINYLKDWIKNTEDIKGGFKFQWFGKPSMQAAANNLQRIRRRFGASDVSDTTLDQQVADAKLEIARINAALIAKRYERTHGAAEEADLAAEQRKEREAAARIEAGKVRDEIRRRNSTESAGLLIERNTELRKYGYNPRTGKYDENADDKVNLIKRKAIMEDYADRAKKLNRDLYREIDRMEEDNQTSSLRIQGRKYEAMEAEARATYNRISEEADKLAEKEGFATDKAAQKKVKALRRQATLEKERLMQEREDALFDYDINQSRAYASAVGMFGKTTGNRGLARDVAGREYENSMSEIRQREKREGVTMWGDRAEAAERYRAAVRSIDDELRKNAELESSAEMAMRIGERKLMMRGREVELMQNQLDLQEKLNELNDRARDGEDVTNQRKAAYSDKAQKDAEVEVSWAGKRKSIYEDLALSITRQTQGELAANLQSLAFETEAQRKQAQETITNEKDLQDTLTAIDLNARLKRNAMLQVDLKWGSGDQAWRDTMLSGVRRGQVGSWRGVTDNLLQKRGAEVGIENSARPNALATAEGLQALLTQMSATKDATAQSAGVLQQIYAVIGKALGSTKHTSLVQLSD